MPENTPKPKAFQAAQPKIPGVPERASEASKRQTPGILPLPYVWAGGGAILIVVVALIWWTHAAARPYILKASVAIPVMPKVNAPPPKPAEEMPVAPGEIATISELSQPWSTKKFLYRSSDGETFPALLVRLPGDTYWAISLREPYGNCQLEFASVAKLRTDYNFDAPYPMIADPCNRTVYDLTRYGSGPNGLARGAIVAGVALRPPLAIEVQIKDKQIFATRAEEN